MLKKDKRPGLSIIIGFILIFVFLNSTNSVYSKADGDEQNKIRTVVIDAGHGGKDSGALGKFSMEKDIVLNISLLLGKYIEENINDVKVIYTRTKDESVPLHKRAEIANENKADLFISIHANANPNPKPYGTSSHVLGLHRAEENFEVAKRENSVILLEDDYEERYANFDPNSPESYIMFSLMQNIYLEQSIEFAQYTQNQFRERAKRKDRGVKQQGLLVLAQTSMPGVLIETGFITNPTEEKFLNSTKGQEYIASALYRAFKNYKSRIESASGELNIVSSQSNEKKEKEIKLEEIHTPEVRSSSNSSVLFKVQIIASENKISTEDSIFQDFSDIEEIKINNIYKYAVGSEKSYEDVVKYSKNVKNKYPDAFIIAIRNGEIIPLNEAIGSSEPTN